MIYVTYKSKNRKAFTKKILLVCVNLNEIRNYSNFSWTCMYMLNKNIYNLNIVSERKKPFQGLTNQF